MEKSARPCLSEKEPSASAKHCSACGVLVKDHAGSHGPQRCVAELIKALQQRIDVLEEKTARHDEELRSERDLHLERQGALLATIEVLEERIASLEQSGGSSLEAAAVGCRKSEQAQVPVAELDQDRHSHDNSVDTEQHADQLEEDKCKQDDSDSGVEEHVVSLDRLSVASDVARSPDNSSKPESSAMSESSAVSATVGHLAPVAPKEPLPPISGGSERAWSNGPPESGLMSGVGSSSTEERPWQSVQSKRSHCTGKQLRDGGRSSIRPGLTGATRMKCSAFYLGGLSLNSQADDIRHYCREHGVLLSGVYLIHTRVWGTQSAKLYVATDSAERVLSDNFLPKNIPCRVWESSPPTSAGGCGRVATV